MSTNDRDHLTPTAYKLDATDVESATRLTKALDSKKKLAENVFPLPDTKTGRARLHFVLQMLKHCGPAPESLVDVDWDHLGDEPDGDIP